MDLIHHSNFVMHVCVTIISSITHAIAITTVFRRIFLDWSEVIHSVETYSEINKCAFL